MCRLESVLAYLYYWQIPHSLVSNDVIEEMYTSVGNCTMDEFLTVACVLYDRYEDMSCAKKNFCISYLKKFFY